MKWLMILYNTFSYIYHFNILYYNLLLLYKIYILIEFLLRLFCLDCIQFVQHSKRSVLVVS